MPLRADLEEKAMASNPTTQELANRCLAAATQHDGVTKAQPILPRLRSLITRHKQNELLLCKGRCADVPAVARSLQTHLMMRGSHRYREAALQHLASLKEEELAGLNLTFGVCMPGDPALKQAALPRPATEELLEKPPGRVIARHSSYSGPVTLWSGLEPLDKPPPPFGLSSAERILKGDPATGSHGEGESPYRTRPHGGLSRNSVGAGSGVEGRPAPGQLASLETVLSERIEGSSSWERAQSRHQSGSQHLERGHLRTPSGGLRDGPNPFASPCEPWLAINPPREASHSDFNPFAKVRSIISPLQSGIHPGGPDSLPQADSPGPSDPSGAPMAQIADSIPSLVARSTCGLSSLNTCDEEVPLSLHPSGFKGNSSLDLSGTRQGLVEHVREHGDEGDASRNMQAATGEAVLHRQKETERGPGTRDNGTVDGTVANGSRAETNARGVLPHGEDGVAVGTQAGDGPQQRGADDGAQKRGLLPHLAESAYPLGAAPQARAAASALNRASAPVASSYRSPAALFNPFKEFATRSFDRVTDEFEEESIPSPLDSGLIGRGL